MATLTTPALGFPYPDGSERVMDGDNAMGALALAIENYLKVRNDKANQHTEITATVTCTAAGTQYEAGRVTITPSYVGQRFLIIYAFGVRPDRVCNLSTVLVLPGGLTRWYVEMIKAANDQIAPVYSVVWTAPAGSAGVAQAIIANVQSTVAGTVVPQAFASANGWYIEGVAL